MTKKERYQALIAYFEEHRPEVETELRYENPFQLLVAVVLSAQCTDKRVNKVTPALFEKFPTPEHLATSQFDEVFPFIKSISYPNNKTKHILGLAKMLVADFDSRVPDSIQDLQRLPGVGRKTANVIAAVIFDQPTMAVDTHVYRVSKRIGLVPLAVKSPIEVEHQLIRHFPKEVIPIAHHWLILHGRYVCVARKPRCGECALTHICRYWKKL